VYSQHPLELNSFVTSLLPKNSRIFCDIGCGYGSVGYLIRVSSLLSRRNVTLIGVDINKKYLRYLATFKIYDHLVLATASNLPFRNKSVDVSIAIEVIEHLNKSDGYKMMQELDRISKDRVILTTPNGFHQVLEAVNVYEIHRSGWTPSELRKLGFKVRGIGIRLWWRKQNKIILFLHHILTPLSIYIPQIGAFLIAWKDYIIKK